uniref:Uncharacterized protein n=1 Tax=Aegilops tauschii TaxID=37682 RepID=N1QVH6_AEGTA
MVVPGGTTLEAVDQLIDTDNCSWRRELIRDVFAAPDADAIRNIPLRAGGGDDFHAWAHERSGIYPVKSVYRALVNHKERATLEKGRLPVPHTLKNRCGNRYGSSRFCRSRPGFLAEDEEPPAKKRKASPPVPVINRKKAPTKKKMTASEREMLAEDLELFVVEIPDHIVQLLKKQSCATRPGEIEIDLHALDDAAAVELQEQRSCRNLYCKNGTMTALRPWPNRRRRKMLTSAVASPHPPPLLLVKDEPASGCGSPSSSSSSSDTDSSDSDSDTVSSSSDSGSEHSGGSDSDSDSDEIGDSPAPAITPPTCEQLARALERQRKEATSRAREKARQELLQMEKMAMPDDTLHPEDLKRLGIDEYNTAKPNNLLRHIGLYLKFNDGRKHQHHHQHQIFEEDLEEGEIRS